MGSLGDRATARPGCTPLHLGMLLAGPPHRTHATRRNENDTCAQDMVPSQHTIIMQMLRYIPHNIQISMRGMGR
jgi:hypothetical protein